MKILIDPGHGGPFNNGATRLNLSEKDVCLTIAKRLSELINETGDINAQLTRSTDKRLSLRKRAALANNGDYDLVICIHNNAWFTKKPFGDKVYYYSEKSKWMADLFYTHLLRARKEKGLRESRWGRTEKNKWFYMLRKTKPITLFLEIGFLSNFSEDILWLYSEQDNDIPFALFKAILKVESLIRCGRN